MRRIWKFLGNPRNMAVLAAVGTVTAFLWTQVVEPRWFPRAAVVPHVVVAVPPSTPAAAPAVTQRASAENGSAVIASDNASVSIAQGD